MVQFTLLTPNNGRAMRGFNNSPVTPVGEPPLAVRDASRLPSSLIVTPSITAKVLGHMGLQLRDVRDVGFHDISIPGSPWVATASRLPNEHRPYSGLGEQTLGSLLCRVSPVPVQLNIHSEISSQYLGPHSSATRPRVKRCCDVTWFSRFPS